MAVMLREGLRRLCADGGWSYAVLWRAAEVGGVRHLVWGEGHFENAGDSLGVSSDHQVGPLMYQGDGRVGDAFEKMKSEVFVVGYGLIGCAALSGNHRWISHNLFLGESEGFVEISNQLRSGIQTLVIIPVLPHGVVQLGSTQMIREDIGFVNRVRSLILQLGCLAGQLIFDNAEIGLLQSDKRGMEGSFENSVVHQYNESSGSRCMPQPSCSSISKISQSRMLMLGELSTRSYSAITTASNSISELQQPKAIPIVSPVIPLIGQHDTQFRGNPVSSDLCILTKEHFVPPGAMFQHKFVPSSIGSGSSDGFTFELPSTCTSVDANISKSNLSKLDPLHLGIPNCAAGSYSQGSVIVSAVGTTEVLGNASGPGKHALTTDAQQFKAIIDLEGGSDTFSSIYPGTFSKISYSANYPMKKYTLTRNQSTEDIQGPDCGNMSANKLSDQNVPSVAGKNSCSTSLVKLSANCSESLLYQGCEVKGSDLSYGTRERLVGSSSRNGSLSTAGKRQSICSMSSISIIKNSDTSLMVKGGNDLFDVLGLCDRPGASDGSLDSIFANVQNVGAWESCPDVSECLNKQSTKTKFDISSRGVSSEPFIDSSQDQLLDAVVSKVNMGAQNCSSDDVVSRNSLPRLVGFSVNDNPSMLGQPTLSEQFNPGLFAISPALVETGLACSSVKSSCSMAEMTNCYNRGSYESQVSLWSENEQSIKSDNVSLAQFRRVDEIGKLNRKRSKPGESPRPRPKDRQMIQDRVKELREIVPNGAKLSIDALLERTIKHMLFLQSVTRHADKLKELGEPKIISKEGGLLLKDNFEGGATWAFEVGSQTMICPIIVEDLNPPRQLLVEMLCEERGFFLEIADLIRGLGLTILKGVMEARSDKVWARFAVEANRDVTRMDIFLSLVQLLEPRSATNAPQQGFDSTNLATNTSCPSLPPGASKPL